MGWGGDRAVYFWQLGTFLNVDIHFNVFVGFGFDFVKYTESEYDTVKNHKLYKLRETYLLLKFDQKTGWPRNPLYGLCYVRPKIIKGVKIRSKYASES